MASTRLHVDATAPAVPMKVAAKAEAALKETATVAPTQLASSAPVAATNPLDAVANALAAWAAGAHQAAVTTAQTRSATVGVRSAQGFTRLADMNAENGADLGSVGHRQ